MGWATEPELRGALEGLLSGVELPRVGVVRQRGPQRGAQLTDPAGAARAAVRDLLDRRESRGAAGNPRGPIAVGVGSRGIASVGEIVAATVSELQDGGYEPFIVPAMGSHGGGTEKGQVEVLETLGISSSSLGVPVRATMDTVVIGEIDGVPVHVDRLVVEAGQAILVARVKPHTDFSGGIESGAAKMAAIGLGKQRGARAIHARGVRGLRDLMPSVGRFVSGHLLIGAVAIVEDDQGGIDSITGLEAEEIGGPREMELLEHARSSMPSLPFSNLDVLVVEQIGKEISGTGMDPNVVGRWMVAGLDEPSPDVVRCIVALRLTEASQGNALGVGLADFVPSRLMDEVNLTKTYVNGLTSGWAGLQRARLPMVMGSDGEAIRAAVAASGWIGGESVRLAWVRDTLHTKVMAVSEPLRQEAMLRTDMEVCGDMFELPLDSSGWIAPLEGLLEWQ